MLKHILSNDEEVWLITAAPEDMAFLIADRLGFTGAIGSKGRSERRDLYGLHDRKFASWKREGDCDQGVSEGALLCT
ncbi:MAG: hypothetical protein WDO06_08835 [Actinomycetota bacterium]